MYMCHERKDCSCTTTISSGVSDIWLLSQSPEMLVFPPWIAILVNLGGAPANTALQSGLLSYNAPTPLIPPLHKQFYVVWPMWV